MSSLAHKLPPPLREGDRLTRDEFVLRWEAMPEVFWAELIDGIVHMPSPISDSHSTFQARLSSWLTFYTVATPVAEFQTGGTWLMLGDSAPQPDLSLRIRPDCGGQSRVKDGYASGAPELIIEVSQTTSIRDLGIKRTLYERAGVCEYIVVQPWLERITWHELAGGHEYRIREADAADGLYRSGIFPGLWLDPAVLWSGDLGALARPVQSGVSSPEHAAFLESHKR